jgi:hypothetical protein
MSKSELKGTVWLWRYTVSQTGPLRKSIRRTKSVYGNARQRYGVNRPGRTSPNVFKKSNKINLLDFEHLVDIEGVTGSIPVAPPSSRVATLTNPVARLRFMIGLSARASRQTLH